ncbi:MAG TPA: hypothetical protein VI195_07155 [Steroidobacteraceae bacterium]
MDTESPPLDVVAKVLSRPLLCHTHFLLDLFQRAEQQHPRCGARGGLDAWLCPVQVITVALDAFYRARRHADGEQLELVAGLREVLRKPVIEFRVSL